VADTTEAVAPGKTPTVGSGEHSARRLGAFLCWAVVFADIGTSVYYTPGILYTQHGIGDLAGLFVTLTLVVFLLLTLKYAEVSVRFPEGGGVVTVSARGLNPWAGAVGGMFILVDYFLTSAISSLSGVQYFQTLVPALQPIVIQLTITLILVGLLGLLNWYGIRESAVVSATIAVAAFVSDVLILLFILAKVPLTVIGKVFQTMLTGHHLTTPILLTGYAGAFLAFSGLESISQLSPVMRAPRKRTVSIALLIVVLTVGLTSPLLTIFSTTLLTHPELMAQTALAAPHTTPDPNQFISLLAGAAGGRVLEVLTAVTASTLLLFASNTAIIGAYHVFLALSRMRFFPQAVERVNKLRHTPHVAIILATAIPMFVLVAVGGRIGLLGDMYAFGLLGAFSLTCLSLDVIRWRERRGAAPVGSHLEPDEPPPGTVNEMMNGRLAPTWERVRTSQAFGYALVMRQRLVVGGAAVGRALRPAGIRVRGLWPDIKYYIGFVTTFLVASAWVINLYAKPLATLFGGGLTVLGVAVSIVHYRYQQSRGVTPVFVEYYLQRIPRSILVVLSPAVKHVDAVMRVACQSADGRNLVVLYLGHPQERVARPFEFAEPYLFDVQAQQILSQAAAVCAREHVPARFIYRVQAPNAVQDAWRVIQPDEIIAEGDLAKLIAKQVSPDYVRLQVADGARVVHAVKHHVSGLETQPAGVAAAPGSTGQAGPEPNGRRRGARITPPVSTPKPVGSAPPAGENGARSARTPEKDGGSGEPPSAAQTTPVSPEESAEAETRPTPTPAQPVDIEDYVWTGTELVRRDELERRSDGDGGEGTHTPQRQPQDESGGDSR
jgi:amino acid transporter